MDEKKFVEKRGDAEKVNYQMPKLNELGSIKALTFGESLPEGPGPGLPPGW